MTWEGRALLLFFMGVLNGVTRNARCGMKPRPFSQDSRAKGRRAVPRSFT